MLSSFAEASQTFWPIFGKHFIPFCTPIVRCPLTFVGSVLLSELFAKWKSL